MRITDMNQGWQSFSSKDQIANILGFAGKIIPIATTQLGLHDAKATKDNTKMKEFTKIYLHTGNWLNLTCEHYRILSCIMRAILPKF